MLVAWHWVVFPSASIAEVINVFLLHSLQTDVPNPSSWRHSGTNIQPYRTVISLVLQLCYGLRMHPELSWWPKNLGCYCLYGTTWPVCLASNFRKRQVQGKLYKYM